MSSLRGVWSLRRPWATLGQVGVADRGAVAHGGRHREAEQVADAPDVAARREDLLEDAVLTESPRPEVRPSPRELAAHTDEARGAATGDEQVWVDAAGPGPRSVVKPCGQPHPHGASQGDGAAAHRELSVDDVGELELKQLSAAQRMEGDQVRNPGESGR